MEHTNESITHDRQRRAVVGAGGAPVHRLLSLQRQIGNAAVVRSVVQRDGDDTDGGGQGQPDTEAPPTDALAAAFDSDDIVGTMAGAGLGAADLAPGAIPGDDPVTAQASVQTAPADNRTVPASAQRAPASQQTALAGLQNGRQGAQPGWQAVQRDPPGGGDGTGPTTRAASVGDLLSAVAAIPEVKAKLDQLKALALNLLNAALSSTGGKVVTASVAVGAASAATAFDPTRKLEFSLLNGMKIPVPIPGLRDSLSVSPIAPNGQLQGATLLFDVGKWIPGMH